MNICKRNLLDIFVKPQSEGGWGLCEWIVSIMVETKAYQVSEIYEAIQSSGLDASVKALSIENLGIIVEYMKGKTFSGVTISTENKLVISYTPNNEGI